VSELVAVKDDVVAAGTKREAYAFAERALDKVRVVLRLP
jgi:hypothetical protein